MSDNGFGELTVQADIRFADLIHEKEKDESLASPQTYTMRRFLPGDEIGVVRCVFHAYGYTYPSPHLYSPERIVELNNLGALISVVAIADLTGEVVGHCAVERYSPGTTAGAGQAVVAPAHRGRALMFRMIQVLEQEAGLAGIRRLVGHEVTSHPASQIMSNRSGYRVCGLALGAMPATLDFKNMTGGLPQRESCMVTMRFLAPPEPAVVCAPLHHRAMLERIYASIERPISFQSLPSPEGPGEIVIRANRDWGICDISVRRIGEDTSLEIRRCLRDLCDTGGPAVIYLELPLDQGGIDDICRSAEGAGFFFVGLGPGSVNEGESLYLQYLNTELEMSRLQIATPTGKEICEYVAGERRRVAAGGAGDNPATPFTCVKGDVGS